MPKSATSIITEIRNGELAGELADHLHEALQSVRDHSKPATVTLKITISPLTKMNLSEPAVSYVGEVSSKPAKAEPPETIFFVDEDGDPTRTAVRQPGLPLTIAEKPQGSAA